ncbi:MAG TPA: hypothetical protein VFQ00_06235 [Terriglobales bacterium]|nr:hypothetical protein [Terriglobales bacterium]
MSFPKQSSKLKPSDAEVWSAIRYLEARPQRGIADLMFSVFLCWLVLVACAAYLTAQVWR